jgi:hypothetical protein
MTQSLHGRHRSVSGFVVARGRLVWRESLIWGWFVFGTFAALWAHTAMAIGAFDIGVFDDSLRLLQPIYAARGLAPYLDYGFVYPPGSAWFYGVILGLREPGPVIATNAIIHLLLVAAVAWQVMRLNPGRQRLLGGAALLLFGSIVPVTYPACGVILLPLALLVMVEVMTRGVSASRLAILAGLGFIGTLIRWDWMLFVAILEMIGAAVIWLAARLLSLGVPSGSVIRLKAVRLCWAGLTLLAGVAAAATMMSVYALANGSWTSMYLFVVEVPLSILPFRRLPLPFPSRFNLQWLMNVIAIALIVFAGWCSWRRGREKSFLDYGLEGVALLAPCVALLPYSFGRADFLHFLPLTVILFASCLAAFTLWPSRVVRWPLLIALVIAAVPLTYGTAKFVVSTRGVPQGDIHLKKIHQLTARCTDLFPSDARSLFVGQSSYKRFIVNFPIVYLMRSDLRPATPFISDEPGIQNSCAFGSRIAADLVHAPRPLVLVLDTKPWPPEKNLTRTMKSCGKIEGTIAAMPAIKLGTCRMADRSFQVMVAH